MMGRGIYELNRRQFLMQMSCAIVSAATVTCAARAKASQGAGKPNFIIFLTDDQGYGDLSCMGATDFRTPNLDRIGAKGVRFTDWYSNAPVCGPSRAALLSGRYPGNAGLRGNPGEGRNIMGLPPETPTIAQALKKLGYHTGIFGKWHQGSAPGCRPMDHGFDEAFGFLNGCIDYYSHIFYWGGKKNPEHDLWENGQEIYQNGQYFTEMVVERARDFLRRAAADQEPFFLYVPFNAPHYPMHAPQKYLDRFPDLPWDRRIMAAMISAADDGVGAILDDLDRLNLSGNTCVFFQSDNGPSRETRCWLDGTEDPYYGGKTGKLKGHKFSLYEGGVREPALMYWPGHVEGGRVVNGVGAAMDLFPTFLRAAGGNPADYQLDGLDIASMAAGTADSPHKEIFWECDKQTAVRRGKWKLVLNGYLVEGTPPGDDVHLSDLEQDMGERENLKDKYPEITAELKKAAEDWRAGIEAHKKR